ncbi:MAG TPA: CoA transferase [Stellaceae bacterium]|nr:CoA transferase [Stellaceae bacterium]
MSKLPLSRFKVIDLTRVRAGPTCVRQLADWGADCIKVEATADEGFGGERHGPDFQNLHRNKRSIAIDLKQPQGVAILKALVKDADVLVENYRPDVKFRLGIDYETLKPINKRLVYASISGFGQDGPYRDRPGFDPIAQGMGGLMAVTGLPGQGPVRAGIPIADLTAGIFAAQGIFIALLEREESGEGQWVQSSLLSAQIAMLDFQGARWTMAHEVPGQEGNNHPTNIPAAVYRTQDGYINIAASSNPIYTKLCQALGVPEMATDPKFSNFRVRRQNRDELNAKIDERTRTKSSAEWVELLNRAGVPCGPIYKMNEVFADPQVKHLKMAQGVDHPTLGRIELVGQPMFLSRTPSSLRTPTPERGQHTDEIMTSLGYDAAAIQKLRAEKVIA